jgi:hypothetical protein
MIFLFSSVFQLSTRRSLSVSLRTLESLSNYVNSLSAILLRRPNSAISTVALLWGHKTIERALKPSEGKLKLMSYVLPIAQACERGVWRLLKLMITTGRKALASYSATVATSYPSSIVSP